MSENLDQDQDKDLLLPESEISNPFVQESSKAAENVSIVAETDEIEDDSPSLREEISLWNFCTPDELYMLLKEDPNRYLPVFEQDRELAQKHRCLVTRDNGKLRIKFRIQPDDRWTECGFFEDFDDEVIYEEFSQAVQRVLNTSRNVKKPKEQTRQEYIKNLNENVDRPHLTTQIDNDPDRDQLLAIKADQLEKNDVKIEKIKPKPKTNPSKIHCDDNEDNDSDDSDDSDDSHDSDEAFDNRYTHDTRKACKARDIRKIEKSNPSINLLLDAYVQQLLERMEGPVREWLGKQNNLPMNNGLEQLLQNLKSVAPPRHLEKDYTQLIKNLQFASVNDFYHFMVNQKTYFCPKYLDPIYDNFLSKISLNALYLGFDYTHNKICQLLNLSEVDVQLLEDHNVDLRELWNNSVNARM